MKIDYFGFSWFFLPNTSAYSFEWIFFFAFPTSNPKNISEFKSQSPIFVAMPIFECHSNVLLYISVDTLIIDTNSMNYSLTSIARKLKIVLITVDYYFSSGATAKVSSFHGRKCSVPLCERT